MPSRGSSRSAVGRIFPSVSKVSSGRSLRSYFHTELEPDRRGALPLPASTHYNAGSVNPDVNPTPDGAPRRKSPLTPDCALGGCRAYDRIPGKSAVKPSAQRRSWTAARDIAGAAGLLALMSAGALAFVWPWLPTPPAGGRDLARYAPLADGDARLLMRSGVNDPAPSWESQNFARVSILRLYFAFRKELADLVLNDYPVEQTGPRRMSDSLVYELRVRSVDASGEVTNRYDVLVREPRGEFLIGFYDETNNQTLLIEPPLHALPSVLESGTEWGSEGKLGVAQYRWAARVAEKGPFKAGLGQFDDCVRVDGELTISTTSSQTVTPSYEWFCAGVGSVETGSFSAGGQPSSVTAVVASNRALAGAQAAPPAVPLSPLPTGLEPSEWRVSRVGRSRATGDSAESTIPPTWIPTDPPIVVVAGYDGDLVAFEASEADGTVAWRFHSGGTVYGPPGVDSERGRIFFGSSDKRVYALDSRGMYLWSFQADDNVAARPVVAGDLVIVASEDSSVYGLDAQTGALVWRQTLGSGVVSSPAVVGDTVVIGSDDGLVYGLNAATGEQRWSHTAEGAVEASIVAADDVVYVADRGGNVTALEPSSCATACEALWSTEVGYIFRTAPAIGADRLFIVDNSGQLIALDRATGEKLWSSADRWYVGSPVVAGDSVIVATAEAAVLKLDLEGSSEEEWDLRQTSIITDGLTTLSHGPAVGGDALWISDNQATLRRLGPRSGADRPAPLSLTWLRRMIEPPFQRANFRNTAVDYGGQAVVLDTRGNIFGLDPTTGDGRRIGALVAAGPLSGAEPMLAGHTLLVVAGGNLVATDLHTGQEIWRYRAGTSLRPPTVAGEIALWLHVNDAAAGEGALDGAAALSAISLNDGSLLWQTPVEASLGAGGTVVSGDTVFVSTPPMALDLATGRPRWRATLLDPSIGGPVVDERGQTYFVGVLDMKAGSGAIVALDASNGQERWRAPLKDDVLMITEAPSLEHGVLVVPGLRGQVVAFDTSTGTERWRFKPPADLLGSISAIDGLVWMMLEDSRVLALRVQDGTIAASFTALQMNLDGQGLAQRPQSVGSHVIIPAGGIVLAFERSDRLP